MLDRRSTPPIGGRGRNVHSTRGPSRGGIQKRSATPRLDRDGDLSMDAAPRGRGRGRGDRGRGTASANAGSETRSGRNASRGLFNGATVQRAIARGLAGGDANIRSAKGGSSIDSMLTEVTNNGKGKWTARTAQEILHDIRVIGMNQSKAASNSDGGLTNLLSFLERKATGHDTEPDKAVRIIKNRQEGEAVIISVKAADAPKILRLNHFSFAASPLTIEAIGPVEVVGESKATTTSDTPSATEALKTELALVLTRRYDPAQKLLNLSALAKDADLIRLGLTERRATYSRVFPALMTICDERFTTADEKRNGVESVTLSDNDLPTIGDVVILATTFPDLKNLDLSNNKFETMGALAKWRRKLQSLDHLILTGCPIEKVDQNYQKDVLQWWPSLRFINKQQVRSEQEVAALAVARDSLSKGALPFPIKPASFQDDGQIAENFLKQFIPMFDTNRPALVDMFYDAESTFSFVVNTSAPRASQAIEDKVPGWELYIKGSRNLTKIQHLSAQTSRLHKGPDSIRERWTTLPATRHPSLLTEGNKWLVECHGIPSLPDPTGQAPLGVGGLIVKVHGEFEEMNVATGQATCKRSFDRTIVLGPGLTLPIRVLNDVLTLRAYGGSDAFVAEQDNDPAMPVEQVIGQQVAELDSFGVAVPGKPDTQVMQEAMVLEMSKRTGMNLTYSNMCLQEKGFDFDIALATFESVKANLPPDAFAM